MNITDQEARLLRELLNAPALPSYGEDKSADQRVGRAIYDAKNLRRAVAR